MLRVEDVRCWRIVDDNGLSQITADLGEVLDIVALVVVAALTKQPVMDNLVYV